MTDTPTFQTAAESARQSAARRDEIAEQLTERYRDYCDACEIEECEPHTFHAWQVHNMPSGPLGLGGGVARRRVFRHRAFGIAAPAPIITEQTQENPR